MKGIPLNSLEEGAEKLLLSLILDAKKGGATRIILPPLEKLANARGVTLQSRNDKQYRFSLSAIDRIKKGDNLGEVLSTAQVFPLLKEGSEKYFEIYEKAFDRAIANLVKKSNGQIKPIQFKKDKSPVTLEYAADIFIDEDSLNNLTYHFDAIEEFPTEIKEIDSIFSTATTFSEKQIIAKE